MKRKTRLREEIMEIIKRRAGGGKKERNRRHRVDAMPSPGSCKAESLQH